MMPVFKWRWFKTKAPVRYSMIQQNTLRNKLLFQNEMPVSSLPGAYLCNVSVDVNNIATHICKYIIKGH